MAKNKRLSRDQKRKQKLAERNRQAQGQTPLAYTGPKYKTEELIPVYQQTELAILEVFIMTDRTLTDRTVRSALEHLILEMRQGPLPPLPESDQLGPVQGNEEAWLLWNIRDHWHKYLPSPRPSGDQLQGVLRTTLHSIDHWSSPGPEARGYLHYIEGFLKKQGFNVEKVAADSPLAAAREVPELLEIGREWVRTGDREPGEDFRDLADEMLRTGEAEIVAAVCRQLLAQVHPGRQAEEIAGIARQAQGAIEAEKG